MTLAPQLAQQCLEALEKMQRATQTMDLHFQAAASQECAIAIRDLREALASGEGDEAPQMSLNAKAADVLRPFLKPGDKVIWREPFRWHDDNGVLSNHYDGMDLESLAETFGYDIDWEFNFHHAAIIRAAMKGNGNG